MNIEQFGSLFSVLGVYNASIVEEFLKNYAFPTSFKINDPTFITFLNKVVSIYKGAKSHLFLIPNVFESATKLYNIRFTESESGVREQDYLLSDLYEVLYRVPGLFASKNESQDDGGKNEASLAFKEFLGSIICVNSIKNVTSTPNKCIEVSMHVITSTGI